MMRGPTRNTALKPHQEVLADIRNSLKPYENSLSWNGGTPNSPVPGYDEQQQQQQQQHQQQHNQQQQQQHNQQLLFNNRQQQAVNERLEMGRGFIDKQERLHESNSRMGLTYYHEPMDTTPAADVYTPELYCNMMSPQAGGHFYPQHPQMMRSSPQPRKPAPPYPGNILTPNRASPVMGLPMEDSQQQQARFQQPPALPPKLRHSKYRTQSPYSMSHNGVGMFDGTPWPGDCLVPPAPCVPMLPSQNNPPSSELPTYLAYQEQQQQQYSNNVAMGRTVGSAAPRLSPTDQWGRASPMLAHNSQLTQVTTETAPVATQQRVSPPNLVKSTVVPKPVLQKAVAPSDSVHPVQIRLNLDLLEATCDSPVSSQYSPNSVASSTSVPSSNSENELRPLPPPPYSMPPPPAPADPDASRMSVSGLPPLGMMDQFGYSDAQPPSHHSIFVSPPPYNGRRSPIVITRDELAFINPNNLPPPPPAYRCSPATLDRLEISDTVSETSDYKSHTPCSTSDAEGYQSSPTSKTGDKMDTDSALSKYSVSRSDSGKSDRSDQRKVKTYSPAAFKFYMEQHLENVLKYNEQRMVRRGQLEDEMSKMSLVENDKEKLRKILSQKESNYIRLRRTKLDVSMFDKIKKIGIGAFGEVTLVQKKDQQQSLYAMKTIRKSQVFKQNQVAHIKAERDLLAEADNEWVVKLFYSFQDNANLYFIMEYVPGGDLMSLLIKLEIFEERLARFYTAELVVALESVHDMGFIHRDIKPDNILIGMDGHIKLTDFGLCTGFRWTHDSRYYQNGHLRQESMEWDAEIWEKMKNAKCQCCTFKNRPLKMLERRRLRQHHRCVAHSLVGTPNYIAPEVLLKQGYTFCADWWSVGVILYEMVVGHAPFLATTPAETQLKVIHWEKVLHIPKEAKLSVEVSDLIRKLCCDSEHRLGKNGASEVKSHPYFNDSDIERIRDIAPPYIPRIKYPTDTSNFDAVDQDKNASSSSSDNGSDAGNNQHREKKMAAGGGGMKLPKKHPEHAFYEFTFRRFFEVSGGGGGAYPSETSEVDEGDGEGMSDAATTSTTDSSNQDPVYV